MELDAASWSGEGTFTAALLGELKAIDEIERLRIEDAPASRTEPGYAFISNEIYVRFRRSSRKDTRRRFGLPAPGRVDVKQMTIAQLAVRLGLAEGIGEPDYADEGLLQYLRTERIVPPYQTKGYKVVEMVRVYEMGTPRRE